MELYVIMTNISQIWMLSRNNELYLVITNYWAYNTEVQMTNSEKFIRPITRKNSLQRDNVRFYRI